ncbi:heme ABC transporter permease [Hirschia baltica]|uniref:Heme exporter protein C n=1 Tax=Hirschia baltica (strain ATCC 49814 / DSM 5838 / IFAM 1418) TaxID=582402 RepID=C6XKW8_HIRBI|nr:heme ABC transporter permease [Hirschia baltica]ACT57797.1 heme exporter protein CcmC [Hirschia baltica ATCC 49814]
MISTFANPHKFMETTRLVGPIMLTLAILALGVGVYNGLFVAPADYRQGDAARIMFIHVPAAMMCMGAYTFMAGASLSSLIWKHALADIAGKSAAPIGAVFTAICLITGSLWGKPIWNTWWEWDARLTSVLVLFFLYLGYIAIWSAFETQQKAARAAAILCLVGAVNLPIIKWSVNWWTTLHQKASIRLSDDWTEKLTKPSEIIHSELPEPFLSPLLIVLVGYGLLFGALTIMNMRAEIYARRSEALIQRRYANEEE